MGKKKKISLCAVQVHYHMYTVAYLSLFEGLEGTALQPSGLFFICWYA